MLPLTYAEAPVVPYLARVGPDDKTFRDRLVDLAASYKNKGMLARKANLSRGALDLLLNGTTKTPTIQTVDALAAALNVSRDYLLYGHDPREEEITTIAQLHDWEVRIMRQRERHIARILAATPPALGPEQEQAVAQATTDSEHANGSVSRAGAPPAREGNAA